MFHIALFGSCCLLVYFLYLRFFWVRPRGPLDQSDFESPTEEQRKQRRHEQELAAIQRQLEALKKNRSSSPAAKPASSEAASSSTLQSNAPKSSNRAATGKPLGGSVHMSTPEIPPPPPPPQELAPAEVDAQSESARKDGEQRLAAAERTGVLASLPAVPVSALVKVAPKLRVIRLENLGIEDLPCLDQELPKLTQIWLSGNLLKELPDPIPFPRLERFDVSNNVLESLPERGWEELTKLRELNCSHNRLALIPKALAHLSSLRVLSLSHNFVADLPPELGALREVTDFDVGNNVLLEIPEQLAGMRSLRRFNAENNRLTALPKAFLEETGVEAVSVSGNKILLKEQEGLDAYLARRTRKVVEDGNVLKFKATEIMFEKERRRRNL